MKYEKVEKRLKLTRQEKHTSKSPGLIRVKDAQTNKTWFVVLANLGYCFLNCVNFKGEHLVKINNRYTKRTTSNVTLVSFLLVLTGIFPPVQKSLFQQQKTANVGQTVL